MWKYEKPATSDSFLDPNPLIANLKVNPRMWFILHQSKKIKNMPYWTNNPKTADIFLFLRIGIPVPSYTFWCQQFSVSNSKVLAWHTYQNLIYRQRHNLDTLFRTRKRLSCQRKPLVVIIEEDRSIIFKNW